MKEELTDLFQKLSWYPLCSQTVWNEDGENFHCIKYRSFRSGLTAVGHPQLCFSNTLCHSLHLRYLLSVVQCHQPVDQ